MQGADGVWSRRFAHGAVARWYPNASFGTMQWAGQPMPPVPPTPPPAPPAPPLDPEHCGKILQDHTFSQNDVDHFVARDAAECCFRCEKTAECEMWAWHGSDHPRMCHLHRAGSALHQQKGTTAAYMPNATRTIAQR